MTCFSKFLQVPDLVGVLKGCSFLTGSYICLGYLFSLSKKVDNGVRVCTPGRSLRGLNLFRLLKHLQRATNPPTIFKPPLSGDEKMIKRQLLVNTMPTFGPECTNLTLFQTKTAKKKTYPFGPHIPL